MAKNTIFIIFTLCLVCQFISAVPYNNHPNTQKISDAFEEADKLLHYVNTVPNTNNDIPLNAINYEANIIKHFFGQRNDELILSCIVKYKSDFVNAVNNSQNAAKACIKNAREKAIEIALEIQGIKEEINNLVEETKTIIDVCVDENTNANTTLQCINDKFIANINGISSAVQRLKNAIINGWASIKLIAHETKICLNEGAENASKDFEALTQNIIDCINSEQ